MPTLEWIGKDKVISHHQEVPFRVLERKYSYDQSGQHAEDNGSENMIIRGDNLEGLKALLPRRQSQRQKNAAQTPSRGSSVSPAAQTQGFKQSNLRKSASLSCCSSSLPAAARFGV